MARRTFKKSALARISVASGELLLRILFKMICLFGGLLLSVASSRWFHFQDSRLAGLMFAVGAFGSYIALSPILYRYVPPPNMTSPRHLGFGLFIAGLVVVALIAASEPGLGVILASVLAAGLVSAAAIALSHRAR